ncbi:MAG: hypothetical protein QOF12_540 [Solirubrobacteraceae bacterium]|nr:hypothetical protein [Solirubrobacteraceae bacterium]
MIVSSRPTRIVPYLLAFALGLGAAGLAACGAATNTALLPASNADQLKSDLDNVASAVDSQDCTKVDSALAQGQRDLDSLPAGTSQRVQSKLQEGLDRLKRQATKECLPTATTNTVQTVTTTVPTTTTPTTTTPTTTTTTPTTTTPTTTTPTTPTTTPTITTPDNTGGATSP